MGETVIKQLLGKTEDKEFIKLLEAQYRDYSEICDKAKARLNDHGYGEKELCKLKKLNSYIMINIQTLADKSTRHIVEMMIIGCNMGVIDAIKNIKKCKGAKAEVIALMEQLLVIEENNLNNLKQFLLHTN